MQPGPRNLITDIAGLRVGNAEDHRAKTGTTVLVADQPVTAGVHIMGGAPGTRETDLLAADKTVQQIDALVLSGGSAFGLDAAGGVMEALHADGRGFAVGPARVPIVPAAILFDLLNGGRKDWSAPPYRALGRRAYEKASREFALGTAGAGTGATAGDLKGGLGSASFLLESGITVGALVAANPVGSVIQQGHGTFWAAPFEVSGEFGGLGMTQKLDPCAEPDPFPHLAEGQNTTIAIVATDAALTKAEATRLATAAHDGMARAIVPSHTPHDGDLVFAVSTGTRPLTDPLLDPLRLGHAASLCLARAIARAVYLATAAENDSLPTWSETFRTVG